MSAVYTEKIAAYFDDPKVRRELLDAVGRLVAVKSVKEPAAEGAPFGPGPRAALDEALKLCTELGFSTRDYDHYVGLVDLNDKETQLHILGHLDVVPEGTGWDTDPYTCVEKDGVVYGRGVADDKGPVICALFAMKAIRDLGIPLSKNVKLIMGTDEESGSSDIRYYYEREPFAPMAFTPDANFPVINIEKGHFSPKFGAQWTQETATPRVTGLTGGFRGNVVPPEAECIVAGLTAAQVTPHCPALEQATKVKFTCTDTPDGVKIHALGKNAHASLPEGGINAIQGLLDLLYLLPLADCPSTQALRSMHELFPFGDMWGKSLGIAMADESGKLTLNLGLMTLTGTGFTASFDSRVPVCATEDNCAKVCRAAMAAKGIAVTDSHMMAAHIVEADSPLVKTLLECYSTYTGVTDPQPIAIGGGTYVHNIPGGVAFGCEFPDFDPKMHSANEQARVEDLMTSAKIFALAIVRLCG